MCRGEKIQNRNAPIEKRKKRKTEVDGQNEKTKKKRKAETQATKKGRKIENRLWNSIREREKNRSWDSVQEMGGDRNKRIRETETLFLILYSFFFLIFFSPFSPQTSLFLYLSMEKRYLSYGWIRSRRQPTEKQNET